MFVIPFYILIHVVRKNINCRICGLYLSVKTAENLLKLFVACYLNHRNRFKKKKKNLFGVKMNSFQIAANTCIYTCIYMGSRVSFSLNKVQILEVSEYIKP